MLREKSLAQASRGLEVLGRRCVQLAGVAVEIHGGGNPESRRRTEQRARYTVPLHGFGLSAYAQGFLCLESKQSRANQGAPICAQPTYTRPWMVFPPPSARVSPQRDAGSAAPAVALRHRRNVSPRHGVTPASLKRAGGITLETQKFRNKSFTVFAGRRPVSFQFTRRVRRTAPGRAGHTRAPKPADRHQQCERA